MTNTLPEAAANDQAFWERLHLIPFEVSFVNRDPQEYYERRANLTLDRELKKKHPAFWRGWSADVYYGKNTGSIRRRLFAKNPMNTGSMRTYWLILLMNAVFVNLELKSSLLSYTTGLSLGLKIITGKRFGLEPSSANN